MRWFEKTRDQRGVIGLIGVIVYSAVLTILGTTMVSSAVISHNNSNQRISSTQSLFNAESGAEDALLQIKRDSNYGNSSTTVNTALGNSQSTTTIIQPTTDPNCSGAKTILAEGYVKTLVRKVQLTNCQSSNSGGGSASFLYAVQAGIGGLHMKNNARVTGGVFSNYNITAENQPNINGDVTVANTVTSAQSTSFDPASAVDFAFANQSARTDAAQSFTYSTAAGTKLDKILLKVRKVGNPQNATVRIVADQGNQPGGQQFAQGTLYAQSVGTTFDWETVGFPELPALSNNTKYWIVIDAPNSGGNYWAWASDNSYANQKAMYTSQWQNGYMVWTDAGTDFAFQTFTTSGTPTYMDGINNNGSTKAHFIKNSSVQNNAFMTGVLNTTINQTVNPGAADEGPKAFPLSDAQMQSFKDEAAAGGTINGNYILTNNAKASLGPKKITGNLELRNNSELTITGSLWVQGNINFENNTSIKLSSSFGPKSAVILSDNTVTIRNNINVQGLNNNTILLIALSSSDNAMVVENNANGIVFYAPNGRLYLKNNATGNAAAAKTILMENNAAMTYSSFLGNIQFSAGGVAGRQTKGWKEVIIN